MSEMTPVQALEQLVRLEYVQQIAATEVKQNLSDNNYRLLDLARNETDFAGIASVIERLNAENVRLRKNEAQSNMQRDFAAKALRQQTRDLKEFYGDD